MNLKKYLQKMAERDAEALITEEDRKFCLQLAEKCVEIENQRKQKQKKAKTKKV